MRCNLEHVRALSEDAVCTFAILLVTFSSAKAGTTAQSKKYVCLSRICFECVQICEDL